MVEIVDPWILIIFSSNLKKLGDFGREIVKCVSLLKEIQKFILIFSFFFAFLHDFEVNWSQIQRKFQHLFKLRVTPSNFCQNTQLKRFWHVDFWFQRELKNLPAGRPENLNWYG